MKKLGVVKNIAKQNCAQYVKLLMLSLSKRDKKVGVFVGVARNKWNLANTF